jgi:cell division protein FtsB
MAIEIRKKSQRLGNWISECLSHPLKVFILCLLYLAVHLLVSGNLIRLAKLTRDREKIAQDIVQTKKDIIELERKIIESKDPRFVEREAKDRLDMANEDDLVFVFAGN